MGVLLEGSGEEVGRYGEKGPYPVLFIVVCWPVTVKEKVDGMSVLCQVPQSSAK